MPDSRTTPPTNFVAKKLLEQIINMGSKCNEYTDKRLNDLNALNTANQNYEKHPKSTTNSNSGTNTNNATSNENNTIVSINTFDNITANSISGANFMTTGSLSTNFIFAESAVSYVPFNDSTKYRLTYEYTHTSDIMKILITVFDNSDLQINAGDYICTSLFHKNYSEIGDSLKNYSMKLVEPVMFNQRGICKINTNNICVDNNYNLENYVDILDVELSALELILIVHNPILTISSSNIEFNDITLTGDLNFKTRDSSLFINGNTNIYLKSRNNIFIYGNTDVSGATLLYNTLTVTENTTLNSLLDVSGATSLHNTLEVANNTTLNSYLDVSGATSLHYTLEVANNTTLNSLLDVSGATSLRETLNVTGNTTLNSLLDVSGATSLNNTLYVADNTTLNSSLDVSGATSLNNTLYVAHDVSFNKSLDVSGSTTLNNTLYVIGKTNLNSTVATDLSVNTILCQTINTNFISSTDKNSELKGVNINSGMTYDRYKKLLGKITYRYNDSEQVSQVLITIQDPSGIQINAGDYITQTVFGKNSNYNINDIVNLKMMLVGDSIVAKIEGVNNQYTHIPKYQSNLTNYNEIIGIDNNGLGLVINLKGDVIDDSITKYNQYIITSANIHFSASHNLTINSHAGDLDIINAGNVIMQAINTIDLSGDNISINAKNNINITGNTEIIITAPVIRFDGNLQLTGNIREISRTSLVLDTNLLILNANIGNKNLTQTPDAGFIVEHHDNSVEYGYFLFNHENGYSTKSRFWDLSGDNLTGNVLEANTLRANIIETNGEHNLTITNNVTAPLFNGNVSGNTGIFTESVTSQFFIGDLSGTTANLSSNVTAPLFIGNVSGNTGIFTESVTSQFFIGDLSGNVLGALNRLNATIYGNIHGNIGSFTESVTAPSFLGVLTGNVSGNVASFTDSVSAPSLLGVLTGNVSGNTGSFTDSVTAPSFLGVLTGNVSGNIGSFTDSVTATSFLGVLTGNVSGNIGSFTDSVSAPSFLGVLTGNVSGNIGSFTESVTAPSFLGALTGNVSGNVGNFTDNVTAPSFLGALTGNVSGNVGNFTDNVTAPSFLGALTGNVSGNVGNFTDNVTAPSFIGNVSGNVSGNIGSFTESVTAPSFLGVLTGNVNGNIGSFTDSVSAPSFIGALTGNVSGNVGNFTDNVTAPSFFGNLQGNITGSQNVYVTAHQFIMDSSNTYLKNLLTIQNIGEITTDNNKLIIDSKGNVTASTFFGNLNGDILADGDISISNNNTGNIIMNGNNIFISGLFGNISMNKAPKITTIHGNLSGANVPIKGNMYDSNTSSNWYPLMYNPDTGEIKIGPPPY